MEITTLVAVALPWLWVLACPLLMLWMMRGMSCHKQQATTDGAAVGADASEDIRLLQARIAELEADRERTGRGRGARGAAADLEGAGMRSSGLRSGADR